MYIIYISINTHTHTHTHQVIAAAEELGVSIAVKLEARDPSDIAEADLAQAAAAAAAEAAPPAVPTMSRPRGPGARGMIKLPGM